MLPKLNKQHPAQSDRRNSEKTGSSVVKTGPQPFHELPSFPSSLYRRGEPGPTLVLGMVFIHRGAVHQDNQEEEKGCGEAEPVHLGGGLAGWLLRMLGMDRLSF